MAKSVIEKDTIVAFIDVLGFSKKVCAIDSEEMFREIEHTIKLIRDQFEYQSDDKTTQELHTAYRKQVKAFSDCIIVSIPLASEMTQFDGTFDPLMSELDSLALAQGSSVLNKVFLRGGVDFGWWYEKNEVLISPALSKAYALEKEANMPVILVSDQVIEYFEKHPHRNCYSKDSEPFSKTFKTYPDTKSGKPSYFLDYMSICLGELGPALTKNQKEEYRSASTERKKMLMSLAYKNSIDGWLMDHKTAILEAKAAATEQKVIEKYNWLIKYHNETCADINCDTDCEIG